MADGCGRASHRELARLVRRAQAGDRAAFDELYAQTAQIQYFAILGKVGPDAAPDILQELYLIAWKNLAEVRPQAFVGYLNGVARNLCRDHFKRQGGTKAPAPVDDEALEAAAHERGAVADEAVADPGAVVSSRDERARLARALREELDDRERDAVLLRYYQGMKLAEVAEELEVSRATAKRIIASALEKLRAKLGLLPVSAALGPAVAAAVEASPAPGVTLGRVGDGNVSEPRRHEWLTRTCGAAALAVAVGAAGFALFAPRAVPVPDEPVPQAEPDTFEAPADTSGPVLAESFTEGATTVFVLRDESGVASAWCIGEDGERVEPKSRPAGDAIEGEWRFSLTSGAWELHAVDALGNESSGTLSADITPDAFS